MTGSEAELNMFIWDFSAPIWWFHVSASEFDTSADSYPIIQSNDRQAQLVSADVYEPTYTVDVLAKDNGRDEISGATVEIDGTLGATQDLKDGEYNISVSADGYETFNQDVTVDGVSTTVHLD